MSLFSVAYTVRASKDIVAPKEVVRKRIQTFQAQQVWSPRLVTERNAKTSFSDGTTTL